MNEHDATELAYRNGYEAGKRDSVKHGRWIGTADGYADGELVYDMWECSECGYDADGAENKPHWHYCPNCGAMMDLEAEHERDNQRHGNAGQVLQVYDIT